MWRKKHKLKTGYKKNQKPKNKPFRLVSSLLIDKQKNIPLIEKIVKFIIYIALRLVIKPSKWKDPEKNFEIIDRTYRRIMSSDFIFIPSSIAFYIVMAFMPIITAIYFVYLIPGFKDIITTIDGEDSIAKVLSKFVPGVQDIIDSLRQQLGRFNVTEVIPILTFLLISMWISAGGFAKIVYTQSYIFEHRFVGGYWMNKFRGMVLVIQFTIILAIGLLINVLIDRAVFQLPINKLGKDAIGYIVLIIALFIFLVVLFLLFYKFSPRFKVKFRQILPGAMVSALPTAFFLTIFGSIANIWSYKNYGVVGAIMYISMASLIITHFVFMGITTNAAYYKTFIGPKVPTKWTISKK